MRSECEREGQLFGAVQFDGEGRLWALGRAGAGDSTVLRLGVAARGTSGQVMAEQLLHCAALALQACCHVIMQSKNAEP